MRSTFGFLAALALIYWWYNNSKPTEQPLVRAKETPFKTVEKTESTVQVAKAESVIQPAIAWPRIKKSNATIPEEVVDETRRIAKMELSSLYVYQLAYFAEFERYSTDLKAMGWEPRNTGVGFKMGFLSPYYPPTYSDDVGFREDPRRMTSDEFIGLNPSEREDSFKYKEAADRLKLSDFSHFCRRGCTADEKGFEVLLASPIGDSGRADVWLVNEAKEFVLVHDGLKE
ncbi:MAG: hypothetical protein ABL958_16400 [Bdellovibrionia bacterium]